MRILSVGSTVIDLFLQPEVDKVEENKLIIPLGEKIPAELKTTSVGGNAANVAVVLKKLGHEAPLYTYLAKDFFSNEIELGLENEGVSVISERIKAKSDFSIVLTLNQDRIIFSHHSTASHGFNYNRVTPDLIYLTSIGDQWEEAYKKVINYADASNIPLALSPGSQQLLDLSPELYLAIEKCKYFFSNKEEAQKIISKDGNASDDISDLIEKLHAKGPKIISITEGSKGSYASDGNEAFKIGVIKDNYVEKTGAGDTYAASFLAFHAREGNLQNAMLAGAHNASSVMKSIGAHEGLLTNTQLQKILKESNLQPERI